MSQTFPELSDQHARFIAEQKIYFVATATAAGRVNVSPKGMDSLRILGARRLVWLNVTGSGNETAAHVQENPRMTLMFCAFVGRPMILRAYGEARVIHRKDQQWRALYAGFQPIPGARQIFDLAIDSVHTSCGMGVPFFDYRSEREQLSDWARGKGEEGLKQYWRDKNQQSIDGLPTYIAAKNL